MTYRTVNLIGGPMDGQQASVEGTVLKVEEKPVVPIVSRGDPLPADIMLKNGTYISDEADPSTMRWNGWSA